MKNNIPERIYERFCKEKNLLDKEKEIKKIEDIVEKYELKKAAHQLYVMYGVDIMSGLNYNDHIKELLLIISK